jgi:tetratricopeptide (TPR) repeat protein
MSMTLRAVCPLVLLAAVGGCAYRTSTDLYRQGQLDAQQGRLTSALAALNAAIRENPRLTPAYVARANVYQRQGRIEEAARDYEQVVRLEPLDFGANFQLGVLYQQLKKFAQAIPVFQRAVAMRPNDLQANMNLALSYMQNGQSLQGLFYAQRAVQIDDKSAEAQANLGVLYAQTQSHASAIEAFKRALELDGHQPEVYLNLGQEYFSTQSYEQARNVLETARSLAPSARVSERLGATYYHLRQFEKGEAAYREALKLEPRNIAALNGLGAVLMSQALLAPGTKGEAAQEAGRVWRQSLALDKNQPAIENLVNQYAPPQ